MSAASILREACDKRFDAALAEISHGSGIPASRLRLILDGDEPEDNEAAMLALWRATILNSRDLAILGAVLDTWRVHGHVDELSARRTYEIVRLWMLNNR